MSLFRNKAIQAKYKQVKNKESHTYITRLCDTNAKLARPTTKFFKQMTPYRRNGLLCTDISQRSHNSIYIFVGLHVHRYHITNNTVITYKHVM